MFALHSLTGCGHCRYRGGAPRPALQVHAVGQGDRLEARRHRLALRAWLEGDEARVPCGRLARVRLTSLPVSRVRVGLSCTVLVCAIVRTSYLLS